MTFQRLIIFFLLITPVLAHSIEVNAKLPNDRQIWPLPSPTALTKVRASFISRKPILVLTRGKIRTSTYLVKYKIESVDKGKFPTKTISFILERTSFTDKNIVQKLPSLHFVEGSTAILWISQEPRDKSDIEGEVPDLWHIQTYEIKSNVSHYKPDPK